MFCVGKLAKARTMVTQSRSVLTSMSREPYNKKKKEREAQTTLFVRWYKCEEATTIHKKKRKKKPCVYVAKSPQRVKKKKKEAGAERKASLSLS